MTKNEINEVKKLAEKYNFKVYETINSIYITTNIGQWRIDDDKNNLKLFHKSMRINALHKRKFNEDYHFQKNIENVRHAMNYIHKHDLVKYNKKYIKKTNVEKLFETLNL